MTKNRTFSVTVRSLPCSCGGMLRPAKMKGKYDATAELGIKSEITGAWLAARCDRCGQLALPGRMLEELSDEAVLQLLKLDRLLSGAESKFLRKAALGIGQEELAKRLGITRVTVARWEGSRSLSAEHDFQLRGLIGGQLLSASRLGPGRWKRRRAELVELVTGVLVAARSDLAPANPPPLRIAA